MNLFKLSGATGRFLDEKSTVFFKPYKTLADGLYRAASPVTAPLIFAAFSTSCMLNCISSLLKVVSSLIVGNIGDAQQDWNKAWDHLLSFGISLCATVVSPIANMVDVIGSGVTSLIPKEDSQEQQGYATNLIAH